MSKSFLIFVQVYNNTILISVFKDTQINLIMCVIIIKQKNNRMPLEVAQASARINPHGLGIVWLDTFEVSYHDSDEYKLLMTDRPFIAHFRYATIGKICKENTHPFICGNNRDELLMMNGTIKGYGNKDMTDTEHLAIELGDAPRNTWKNTLSKFNARFVSVNLKSKSFQIYNRNLFTYRDGIWYSKTNVLQDNLVAVYGTLKKGYSNYWNYLTTSTYLGSGSTQDRYPLVINGLPYLVDKKGTGHNVEVDVFKVNDAVMDKLDRLEGHPNWYVRKQVPVKVNGKLIKCWVYFNPQQIGKNTELHKSYIQKRYPNNLFSTDEQESVDLNETHDTYEFGWDDNDFPTEETPYCVDCFNDLTHDGFANYYCSSCGGWFTEKDVLVDNK